MALPIIEQPLYGQIALETSAWSTPFTWVDRTADLVAGVTYSEGGRIGVPGSSPVDVGTLNATFKNLASVPVVGDLVRLRRAGTTEYAFTGYVQDVSQRIVFDSSVSYTTPITLTTINCVDWVGYISQFQTIGIGGANPSTGSYDGDSTYTWDYRIAALNLAVDATFATKIIGNSADTTTVTFGDTDRAGTFAEHLDIVCNTGDFIWYGTHNLPTNKTTGRTSLVYIQAASSASSSGKTFTDEAGTTGQLHYTEIDFENSTQNVANTIVVKNRTRFHVWDSVVTKIGGFNEENYMMVNGTKRVGVSLDNEWKDTDSTSITSYGIRQTEIESNVAINTAYSGVVKRGFYNMIANPSAEYSDDGYTGGATNKVRRRQPSFGAYSGTWAMRSYQTTATATVGINYSGGESDGIPDDSAFSNYVSAWVARGSVSRTDVRAQIQVNWYGENEALISSAAGTNVSLTNADTWYRVKVTTSKPANAVRATINIIYTRTGGGNHSVGDILWADALLWSKVDADYFDGDTVWDNTYGYIWTGGLGASFSYKVNNNLDAVATLALTRYANTTNRVTRIRWNAQEDLTAVSSLSVGKTVSIRYDGTTTTYRIVGIDGTIDPERYMIDYYVQKV